LKWAAKLVKLYKVKFAHPILVWILVLNLVCNLSADYFAAEVKCTQFPLRIFIVYFF
jgi:hypothetical protein